MSTQTERGSLGDVPGALMNLVQAQMRLTSDLLESATGMKLETFTQDLQKRLRGGSKSCCHIPPPCWMPRQLGECTSHVSECNTACIDLVITNCDRVARQVSVQASGPNAALAKIQPGSAQLGPFERQTVRACVTVPQGADGKKLEILLWVRGCREHLLRWVISVGTAGVDSCHEVRVNDCPDYLHHWYDHFYCARGCTAGRTGATVSADG
jgi:hypothetical protein